ncbi:unnamed protein product [Rotaria socialis]|uniref:ubiquitinyl hydrolase 1 n=4 Tax=Rotaria socialis TaxID=392032 RepID=A0A820SWC9_9BILA|nr:unnamed protein product [Rotaria socialis]CAF4462765.1 unnamed protein product [Rotaria socialis]
MPHGCKNVRQFQELNESILNHLFLPLYLPSSAEADFCIRYNHRNEYMILECVDEFLNSMDTTMMLPIIQVLIDCTQNWSMLQKMHQLSGFNLQLAIEKLTCGSFLPLYFHAQNAAILIEIDENNSNQALISSWQVLLPTDAVTSSVQSHLSRFPTTIYRLFDRSYLSTTVHCELLIDFMKNPIEYSKAHKASREINETKDVPMSHYVCQWWIQRLPGIKVEHNSNTLVQFSKKHRDQVRWNTGPKPFRRSGLWMTIKVVFQTILTKRFGHIGVAIYKLLITHFLTHIISTRHSSVDSVVSVDLLVHCIRKILRRLNKIESLLSSIDSNDVNKWIQLTIYEIQKKIDEIFPKMDWQSSIRISEKQLLIDSNLNDTELYRHSCETLKKYLNSTNAKTSNATLSNFRNYDDTTNVEEDSFMPSFSVLTNQFQFTIGTALTRMEIWATSWSERWIDRPPSSGRETEHFQMLAQFFDHYQSQALKHYCSKNDQTDPIGYSQFILTSLTIICAMHHKLCQDQRFERLKFHCIDIPNMIVLFEYLVLLNREDMIRARSLYDYFQKFTHQSNPDILTDIEAENSFGVYFASHSTKMTNILRKIQTQSEQDKKDKIQEVQKAKDKYTRLMNSINGCPCTCYGELYSNQCRRCRIEQQADSIGVSIYECPIPSKRASALAVMFELRMPIEVRCYRDVVWQFANRFQLQPVNRMYEWLKVRPHSNKLESYFTGPNNSKVKLVSSTNSITQSHGADPSIALAAIDDFLYENSLQVELSPTHALTFQDERRLLTPQLNHPDYKHLQFSIESTQFVQNRVIAELSQTEQKLKPNQLIEFGSFRSGHRLQWWNLLTILELDSLSLGEESVAILIIHSILQYGPVTENPDELVSKWCPESHRQLLDDHFVDELILRLNRHLDECTSLWQNELVLVVITIITMRILTVCNSTREEKVADLALKCRRIGEKWIDLISTSIQTISSSRFDEIENLRRAMVTVNIACLLTFSTHTCVLSSNQHIISLLKAATNMNENLILSKNHMHMSNFLKYLIRFIERLLVPIQPTVAEILKKSSYQSLNDFSVTHWAVIRTEFSFDGEWKKRNTDIYDGWYDGQYESTCLSINCLKGIFLVNGMSISYLPEKIISNELYIRVFEHYIFPIQIAAAPNTYISRYSNFGDEPVQYEFYFDDQLNRLIVCERHIKTNEIFELIPPTCFDKELPAKFISEYSHWKNIKNPIVEFRPIHFQDPDFLNYKPYVLNIETGYVTTTETLKLQILINRSSSLFQNLYRRYFHRLDEQPYLYMMNDDASNIIERKKSETDVVIHIHLSRLAIAFKYNMSSNCFVSREYSDMCIDEDQWIGTLTGLNSGLLLSPIKANTHSDENFKFRKLIVPFGHVSARQKSSGEHQTVTIQRSSSMSYAHQYFVFSLNDRLRIIQSTDCPSGWLYLALLHALTSHHLPDQYTEMTGMERAFQLLNSAGCWTDQPFDSLSLNILRQIAFISPKANYHRHSSLSCMQKIDWNCHSIPYSLQHCGYYLIAKKMIHTSEKFNFMHPSLYPDETTKLGEEHEYDERLLAKLYWDYRNSYNPTARLSAEIEAEMLNTRNEERYQPMAGYNSSSIVNHEQIQLVNDMYSRGDVYLKEISKMSCFPLSQWLTDEYALANVWVGLLKLADAIKTTETGNINDDIQRFELLLDFLLYISSKRGIRPFYLQMLNTVLHVPTISMESVVFPPFTQYNNIQHITVTMSDIVFNIGHSASERKTIIDEVKHCFEIGHVYKDQYHLTTSEEKNKIKFLLKSWHLNSKLRSFLINVQNLICSSHLISLKTLVAVYPQQFLLKSIEDHFQIEIKSTNKQIDQKLLLNAQRKYLYPNSDFVLKSIISRETINQHKKFPADIFSAIDDQQNDLSEIGNYFKNHFTESWKQLQAAATEQKEYPSREKLIEILQSFYQESAQFWKELIESITHSHEQFFRIGLVPRTNPTILISIFQQIWLKEEYLNKFTETLLLTKDQRTLLGGLMVNWTVEQQIERALDFVSHNKQEEFEKELSNTPHVNWTPSKHLPWLIFELEMNITIREIQVDVARHMTQSKLSPDDPTIRNIVMQMNMGEGKTSIIIPMLALSLCSPLSSLVRIVILKSLFPMNYQSLRLKLGALLNRRIFSFSCRRDMNFNDQQINQIFERFEHGLHNCDVILVTPEDILSFDLLTIDACRRHEFDTGRSMLSVQRWLKKYIRDVLDESDEILHCKYQLIYTVGHQQQVDGGVERWELIQWILSSVKKFAVNISQSDQNDLYYKSPERKSGFPEFRLLSYGPFPKLCAKIANDWLNQRSYRKTDQQCILSFILDTNISIDILGDRFSSGDLQMFLIIRGLLSSEVLYFAFKKRYRVNYGVNITSNFKRLMAVPFRAKDVPAERTEFGHPDIALVLTQLSYYYSGLNDAQMLQCFDRLNREEQDPELIYAEWISHEDDNDTPQSIKQQWKKISLKDCQQEIRQLFFTLRFNMSIINYFLNHFVFPREAKQFPYKLVASAWNFSSAERTNIITGFSGTNDTQLLLPVDIHQCDLPQLQKTDAVVINNLLQPENENYRYLPVYANLETILYEITNYKPMINVILDVGALLVEGTNREIAMKWLKLSDKNKIDYAVYFEFDCVVVCDRQFQHHSFLTSPASEQLDRCVIYLDEVHTRGTDFKFPNGFTAAVTLGSGVTKDRFVQACMRMRRLGNGHSLTFWSSDEVHRHIVLLKRNLLEQNPHNLNDSFELKDILRWVYENTQQATWDGLHHWAVQSLSYQRRISAFQNIQWMNHLQIYTNEMMEELAEKCLEPEIVELKSMYGQSKVRRTISEIYTIGYQHANIFGSEEIHNVVQKRMLIYGGLKQRLSQFLDEEQQRELEQELEQEYEKEEEQKSIRSVRSCLPILHDEIKRLCDLDEPMLNLAELPLVFRPLAYAFIDSTFFEMCQSDSWQPNFWISAEFQRVIETDGDVLDPFLRSPRWLMLYRSQHVIFVNAFEANWLMGQLQYLYRQKTSNEAASTSLRLLLPRLKRNQSIFVNTPTLTIPPFVESNHDAIPLDWLVELFIFNGTAYFETVDEQTAYCQCLALCPKLRTPTEENAFENDWISVDGFVKDPEHRRQLQIDRARFNSNPLAFIKRLFNHRNNTSVYRMSHIGSIIFNSSKLLLPEQDQI